MTLSICVLAKNNEDDLRKTLQSVQGDEIIVVDWSGKDKLKKAAQEFGAAFHVYEFSDDLPGAMSETIRFATGEWILFLHAGEALSKEDAEKLTTLKEADAYTFHVNEQDNVRLFRNFAAIHFEEGEPPQVEPILARIQATVQNSGINL